MNKYPPNSLRRLAAMSKKIGRITDHLRNAPHIPRRAMPPDTAFQLETLSDKTLFITCAIDAMSEEIDLSRGPVLNGLLTSLSDIYTGIDNLIPDRSNP